MAAPEMQRPSTSHAGAGVATAPAQNAAPHVVPTGYLRHPPLPSQRPSVPQVATALSTQVPRGSRTPAAVCVQRPRASGPAQDRHGPVHADSQHTPSAQNPDRHSEAAPQLCPLDLRPQLPAVHVRPGTQSSAPEQRVRQALPTHRYGAQATVLPGRQVPDPSQVAADVRTSAAQAAGEHTVPAGCFEQPPVPSQRPLAPQVAAGAAGQSADRCGLAPAATRTHVPAFPGTLHARQGPAQTSAQQVPSMQWPLAHSDAPAHDSPLGFFSGTTTSRASGMTAASSPSGLASGSTGSTRLSAVDRRASGEPPASGEADDRGSTPLPSRVHAASEKTNASAAPAGPK